jgi:hypothetical protein
VCSLPQGRYNYEYGANVYQIYPSNKNCPVGSISYSEQQNIENKRSIQLPLYEDTDLTKSIIIYQTSVSVPLFLVMVYKVLKFIYHSKPETPSVKPVTPAVPIHPADKTKVGKKSSSSSSSSSAKKVPVKKPEITVDDKRTTPAKVDDKKKAPKIPSVKPIVTPVLPGQKVDKPKGKKSSSSSSSSSRKNLKFQSKSLES